MLPALHRGKVSKARSAHFHIRAAPSTALPRPRPPPFPTEYLRKRPQARVIRFAFTATKAGVSKLATTRNRARRRLKAAVEVVVNGRGGYEGSDGVGGVGGGVEGVGGEGVGGGGGEGSAGGVFVGIKGSPDLVLDGESSSRSTG